MSQYFASLELRDIRQVNRVPGTYIKLFLISDKINLNKWQATHEANITNLNSFLGRPSGMIYKIYEMSKMKMDGDTDSPMSQFKVHEIPASMVVQTGLINDEFLDAEQDRLGPMYQMYYECNFYNSTST